MQYIVFYVERIEKVKGLTPDKSAYLCIDSSFYLLFLLLLFEIAFTITYLT